MRSPSLLGLSQKGLQKPRPRFPYGPSRADPRHPPEAPQGYPQGRKRIHKIQQSTQSPKRSPKVSQITTKNAQPRAKITFVTICIKHLFLSSTNRPSKLKPSPYHPTTTTCPTHPVPIVPRTTSLGPLIWLLGKRPWEVSHAHGNCLNKLWFVRLATMFNDCLWFVGLCV